MKHFNKQNEKILRSIGAFEPEETYNYASEEDPNNNFAEYMKQGREICETAGIPEWEEVITWGYENGIKLIELPEEWEQAQWNEIEERDLLLSRE